MGDSKFEATPLGDGSGWQVVWTNDRGATTRITPFEDEAEAQRWIETDAQEWLLMRRNGRSFNEFSDGS